MRVSISYSTITEDSASDGAHADNGWIDGENELRHTLNDGDRDTTIAYAREGTFDWTSLRDAIRFMREKCSHIETCWFPDGSAYNDAMTLYGTGNTDDCEGDEIEVCYDLHIAEVSRGTMLRIARMMRANGVHFANWRPLRCDYEPAEGVYGHEQG